MTQAYCRAASGALVVAILVAIGCRMPPPSDIGHVGTWERGGTRKSQISIRRDETGAYRFAWRLRAGENKVRCDRQGSCSEYIEGERIYAWRFLVSERDGSDDLFVERVGTPVAEGTPLRELDRLEVQPGGLELWTYTLERNGEVLEPPEAPRRFRKVSDRPF